MSGGAPPPVDGDLETLLHHAGRALDQGEVERAREFAKDALERAKSRSDLRAEAHALTCLAHCDRLASRLRRASDASRRAAQLFSALGDGAGAASALAILSHASCFLGRNDEAIEAGLLSLRLATQPAPHLSTAVALNYLGVAYGWSGRFADAHAALDAAVDIAAKCTPPASRYQPRVNQAWLEAIRLVWARHRLQRPASLDPLTEMIAACAQLEARAEVQNLVQGSLVTSKALSALLNALHCCWMAAPDQAQAWLQQGDTWLSRYPVPTWLDGFACWVAGEIAFGQGRPDDAAQHFRRVTLVGAQVEHEQLVCLGHLLDSQLHTEQGRHEQAAEALRKLRQREHQVRIESLESRARAVDLMLAVRQNEQDMVRLSAASRQFERWSFEDPLTGIANRRSFERHFIDRMRSADESRQPLCLALIDVDRFKQINDTCSHLVGDQVLKTLAGIFEAQVREHDLVARLAGDEFVVVLPRSDLPAAQQVCQRIRSAVQEFPWKTLADSIQVSVSVGAAQYQPGDDAELLIGRSDMAMYAHKRAQDGAEPAALGLPQATEPRGGAEDLGTA